MPSLPFTEAATGTLGQGLSVGVGVALTEKMEENPPQPSLAKGGKNMVLEKEGKNSSPYQGEVRRGRNRVYVLLGDSEMAEGQVWEAIELATYYKLDNLVGIIDVNRLGQRGQTMAWR